MNIQIVANADLQSVPLSHNENWQSTGDDPFFDLRFGAIRRPIIVCYLKSDNGRLDARAYINRGRGYCERDAMSFEPAKRFIFVANVGWHGLIRSFRIDPASFSCELYFSVETYKTSREADAAIAIRLQGDMVGASFCDLGKLPRFRARFPAIKIRRSANEVQKYIHEHSRLAENVRVEADFPQDEIWLSIVVPVFNAPKRYLDDLVKSFELQNVQNTELILSDDGSTDKGTRKWFQSIRDKKGIKVVHSSENGGIAKATNAGLSVARGTWIGLLDHDDVIAPHALKLIFNALATHPDTSFLYTDEVVVDDHLTPKGLMLKPAFDPVLLSGVNYINHFSIYRHERLRQLGYLRSGFDGSQDYDLLLRYTQGLDDSQVLHLPYPAYLWRRNGHTYSRQFMERATNAARQALFEFFRMQKQEVSVKSAISETLHRIEFRQFEISKTWPKISIIVPSINNFNLINRIIGDLYERTDYPNFEVIIVDNGTTDRKVLEYYDKQKKIYSNLSIFIENQKFNFSRAINIGISKASGQHFLLLNNDVEVTEPTWLKEMVSCLNFERSGIVGAKLLYATQKIQHAGVIAGFGGLAGHWYLNKPADYGGPMNRLHVRNSMTCVTGAAMLISGECARQVGKWDEENFAIAYNDVDYCLRAYKAGFRTIWTPFACLVHHESVSRGSDVVGERKVRFEREKDNLRLLHGTATFEDPAINPGYDKRHSTPGLEMPLALAVARTWYDKQRSNKGKIPL